VKGSSAAGLITCPNIDGFLVGGASLLPEFVDIIKVSERTYYIVHYMEFASDFLFVYRFQLF
jgi:hypothetical protein